MYRLSASSSARTSSSQVGGDGAGEIASVSRVLDSNSDARRKLVSPHAGQRGSSSSTVSEIEYPQPTQTRDPPVTSVDSRTSNPSSTSKTIPRSVEVHPRARGNSNDGFPAAPRVPPETAAIWKIADSDRAIESPGRGASI